MEECRISSLEEYLSKLHDLPERILFRGMSDEGYKLIPSLGRLKDLRTEKEILENERKTFYFFKSEMVAFGNYFNCSTLEILSLEQHYGLPTRLLDWSQNPLVALFFAVNKINNTCNSVIYSIKNFKYTGDPSQYDKIIGTSNKKIDEIKDYIGYVPTRLSRRLSAQQSYFTIHINPFEYIKDEDIYQKFIIPVQYKKDIYDKLKQIGIHEQSMFPDLDGVCRLLKRNYLS